MPKFLHVFALLILTFPTSGSSQEKTFATISGGDLYSFDLSNCTRHFIGSTGQGFGDIAFTTDGRLWGIISGQLYHIDTASANATLIGNTGVGAVSLVGLNDTTLLAESAMKLYSINTNNATSSYIDTIGFQAAGDLTWYDDDLFMVTAAGQIIRMVLNSFNTALVSVTPIGNSIPTCEGAVTASFVGDYNSIVGFNGPNLIKICQIDGSSDMLCPNLNIGGTPGGASIRLPNQNPQPTDCDKVNSVDHISGSSILSVIPNPFARETVITVSEEFENLTLKLYSITGKKLKELTVKNQISIVLNSDRLSGGIYILRLEGNGKSLGFTKLMITDN